MDKKSKKNLIIRLAVYSVLTMVAVFSIWFLVTAPPRGHKIWMKMQGIEFCETPQEAIHLYAKALIKGDREEALLYIYKPKNDTEYWEAIKKRLYKYTDEELKRDGEVILNGHMEKEGSETAEWAVIYNIDGETVGGLMDIWKTDHDGWKLKSV